jgi:hypothetical protein
LVEGLLHERIASVSCGSSTTIALTAIKHEWVGHDAMRIRELTGGRVYAAGSGTVLGRQCDAFTHIPVGSSADRPAIAKQVSAGFSHSAVVTAEGELYLWGRNNSGCCAAPSSEVFISRPRLASCLFESPVNLARDKKVYQCSTLNMREATIAINGSTDGSGEEHCASTQMESQAWWEVDLGDYARIDKMLEKRQHNILLPTH